MIEWKENKPYSQMTVNGSLWFFVQPTFFGKYFKVWVPEHVRITTGIKMPEKFNSFFAAKSKADELFNEWLDRAGLVMSGKISPIKK